MSVRVVVVDNEPVDRYVACRRLARSRGFGDVLEYESGEEFIQDLREDRIPKKESSRQTLVLMDINMPRMDGFQTIEASMRHISETINDVIFVMYTSSSIVFDREVAAGLPGVRGYITKPIDDRDIEEMQRLCAI